MTLSRPPLRSRFPKLKSVRTAPRWPLKILHKARLQSELQLAKPTLLGILRVEYLCDARKEEAMRSALGTHRNVDGFDGTWEKEGMYM